MCVGCRDLFSPKASYKLVEEAGGAVAAGGRCYRARLPSAGPKLSGSVPGSGAEIESL